jgi:large subunit ribosomal protein L29
MAKRDTEAYEEYRAMDSGRLGKELNDSYRQLFSLRLQVATRQLQNVKEIGKTKRKIARIKTLQRQRELVAAGGGQ